MLGLTERFWENVFIKWKVEGWNNSTQTWFNLLFLSTPHNPYYIMQDEIEIVEFVQALHFEVFNSLKNTEIKFLLSFDDSCARFCNSKAIFGITIVNRHRGFSNIYIKHKLFHKSKLGRDVEIQNTIVFFQVTSRCASSRYIKWTVRSWINSHRLTTWFNFRSFWSEFDWFVPANRQSHTLLHKMPKYCIKVLCSGKLEAFETLGRWRHWINLLSRRSNTFPAHAKFSL